MFCFVCCKCSAQINCGAEHLISEINPGKAGRRIKVYKKFKKEAIYIATGKYQLDSISYSTKVFQNLLTAFCTSKKVYDGLRVYFAILPDNYQKVLQKNNKLTTQQAGDFTFIFVPTTTGDTIRNGKKFDVTRNDDTTNFWIIQGDTLQTITADKNKIAKWIHNYKNSTWKILDSNGISKWGLKSFVETESLWYRKEYLKDSPGGMLHYLNCDSTKIDRVSISLAGYKGRFGPFHRPYSYKLTLIFGFWTEGPQEKAKFVSSYVNQSNGDTGSPCPPAVCNGRLLLQ